MKIHVSVLVGSLITGIVRCELVREMGKKQEKKSKFWVKTFKVIIYAVNFILLSVYVLNAQIIDLYWDFSFRIVYFSVECLWAISS